MTCVRGEQGHRRAKRCLMSAQSRAAAPAAGRPRNQRGGTREGCRVLFMHCERRKALQVLFVGEPRGAFQNFTGDHRLGKGNFTNTSLRATLLSELQKAFSAFPLVQRAGNAINTLSLCHKSEVVSCVLYLNRRGSQACDRCDT